MAHFEVRFKFPSRGKPEELETFGDRYVHVEAFTDLDQDDSLASELVEGGATTPTRRGSTITGPYTSLGPSRHQAPHAGPSPPPLHSTDPQELCRSSRRTPLCTSTRRSASRPCTP